MDFPTHAYPTLRRYNFEEEETRKRYAYDAALTVNAYYVEAVKKGHKYFELKEDLEDRLNGNLKPGLRNFIKRRKQGYEAHYTRIMRKSGFHWQNLQTCQRWLEETGQADKVALVREHQKDLFAKLRAILDD